MESKSTGRFTLGKQSSLAPDRGNGSDPAGASGFDDVPDMIDANIRLMYAANEGDLEGIRELLDSGVDVNFRDIDGRTALHVAACQGSPDVVELLLEKGVKVDPDDRWGSTGDLCAYLKRKGALKPELAVRFALDIARGINYLHEHKPEVIIHRDLEPSNILRDDSGHLKVADFDVSKLLKVTKRVREDRLLTCQDTACRYMAPEIFRNEEYDAKVDVFSFSLILQEMIEGFPPFSTKLDNDIPKAYASKERPPFIAPLKLYSYGIKELIEQCWSENPADRPRFREIIDRLTYIQNHIAHKRRWKVRPMRCFQNLESIWKRDNSNPSSSRSSRSTKSNF